MGRETGDSTPFVQVQGHIAIKGMPLGNKTRKKGGEGEVGGPEGSIARQAEAEYLSASEKPGLGL